MLVVPSHDAPTCPDWFGLSFQKKKKKKFSSIFFFLRIYLYFELWEETTENGGHRDPLIDRKCI